MAYPLILILTIAALITACEKEKATLFSGQTSTEIRNHNGAELNKARETVSSKNFSFYAISDSHQNYEDLSNLIAFFNQKKEAQFIVSAGDFTDFGTNDEYEYYLNIIKNSELPLMTTIGNHDAIGTGPEIFLEHFGPYNFVFDLPNTRLIFFNNNRLEFLEEGLDRNWLKEQLDQAKPTDQVILIHHIDPFSKDYFDSDELALQNELLLHPNLDLIINGHRHVFDTDSSHPAVIHQVARVEGLQYSMIEFVDGRLIIRSCVREACREDYNATVD